MLVTFSFFIIGVIALIVGAKLLVLGASQLASLLKISPLIIGLTIVAFGTSTPEITVCALGAWRGEGELVIGNVLGSNILNILLVLGLCATIAPLYVKKQIIRLEIPLMIGASVFFWLLGATGTIGRWKGIILFAAIITYLLFVFRLSKNKSDSGKSTSDHPSFWRQLAWVFLGLLLLAIGSDLLIKNAVKLARQLKISELFIGLTIVAVGTSLPEIATSIVAVLRRKYDLVVGNLIGSNLFNLLAGMGIAGMVAPDPIVVPPASITFDFPIMVATSIACLPIFLTGHRISRWEGIVFLFFYSLYITYLILFAVSYPLLSLFTIAFFFFILPLTVITLLISIFRHFHKS